VGRAPTLVARRTVLEAVALARSSLLTENCRACLGLDFAYSRLPWLALVSYYLP